MNKLFTKIATLAVGAVMAIGVGVAVKGGREAVKAEEVVAYTLDPVTGGSNGYATDSTDLDIDGIKWTVTGNTTLIPWRIGGKNLNGVDRYAFSQDVVSTSNISKVELTVGTSNLTVNSVKLLVGSSAKANDVSEVSAEFNASSTLTFARPAEDDWASRYFSFVFNVTAGSSNKYVQFSQAVFYAEEGEVVPHNYVDLYYANNRSWENVYAYAWKDGGEAVNAAWPGVQLEKVDINRYNEDIYRYHLDTLEWDRIIFNNGGNGEQSEDIDISAAETLDQYYLNQDLGGGKWSVAKATYVPHGTVEDDPLTFAQAFEKAQELAVGASTSKTYFIKGTVVAGVDTYSKDTPYVYSGKGNLHIGNEEDKLLVYNALDFDKEANFAEDFVAVGDEIVVCGSLTNYKGTLEIASGNYLVSVNGYKKAEYAAVAAALAVINCDANGVDSVIDWVTVKEELDGFEYLKVVEADANGNRLEQFMAKYDYIVAKYGKEAYEDFLDRQPVLSESANSVSTTPDNNSIMLVVVVTASVSTIALGLLVFLRKKRLAK